ncbi:hypothetical protein BJY01DRAFT_212848 [Aspergillus pseudoustus]|uniref:Ankyrin repeat-containing domain protein n=1 Tax=Aspergillus pseudoustus TaxID=1810923 RepID=A0ABR4K4E5_9EURO
MDVSGGMASGHDTLVVDDSLSHDPSNIDGNENAPRNSKNVITEDEILNSSGHDDEGDKPHVSDGDSVSSNWTENSWQGKIAKAIHDDDPSRIEDLLPSEYLDKTFTFGFRSPHPAMEIHPTAETWTALLWAAAVGSTRVVSSLLERGADVFSQARWEGSTAFHIAAICGNMDILELLFKRYPDLLELTTTDGETALTLAAREGRLVVVEYLLARGADPTVTNLVQQTALHSISEQGHAHVCRALLSALLRDTDKGLASAITAVDRFGNTAFDQAVRLRRTDIVLQLLETPVYFPSFPFENVVVLSASSAQVIQVESLLLQWMDISQMDEVSRHWEAVLCWAILNGRESLIDLNSGIPLNREEASWVHIAAIGGHVHIMKRLLSNTLDIVSPARGGITPLHLAATYGRIDLIRHLIEELSQIHDKRRGREVVVLDAILMTTGDDRTVLECAILGGATKHKIAEVFLWEQIHKTLETQDNLFSSYPQKIIQILELAAKYDPPGREENLHRLFHLMSLRTGAPAIPNMDLESTPKALHRAVYYQEPRVVWWLLTNGAYFAEKDLKRGIEINHHIQTYLTTNIGRETNSVIRELLANPPPIRKHYVLSDGDGLPPFEFQAEDYGDRQATVVDFYMRDHHLNFRMKRHPARDIIYGEGPQNLMDSGDYRDVEALKARLQTLNLDYPNLDLVQGSSFPTLLRDAKWKKDHLLRWFHFPHNDELMVRMSRDRGIKATDHRTFAQSVLETCIQVPAGGKKFSMKPQCVRKWLGFPKTKGRARHIPRREIIASDEFDMTKHQQSIVSLYMPYISWAASPPKQPETELNHKPRMPDAVPEHTPITLDQYYYVSLDDTAERDMDQVMGRHMRRQIWHAHEAQTSSPFGEGRSPDNDAVVLRWKHPKARQEGVVSPGDETLHPLLVVGQLWLWILDEETIITCTSKEPRHADSSFLQRVLDRLSAPQTKYSVRSAESMVELIASTAVNSFNTKQIPVLQDKVSPLEVFRGAIWFVRSSEAEGFKKFQASFNDQGGMAGVSQRPWGRDDGKENEYLNIAPEIGLLVEIKDICDELNILKSLVEDQEDVWRQASEVLGNGDRATFTHSMPSELKGYIMGMIQDAEVVQKAVYTLLDLKQKQASPTEAKFARQQAEDTAKQTDTIVVFTVVTIVFLPLSFLTSLFALNISNFPHEGDQLAYKGWWIFPILFGVSVVVSGFFMTIAFQANSLKMHLANGWRHLKTETKKKVVLRRSQSMTGETHGDRRRSYV